MLSHFYNNFNKDFKKRPRKCSLSLTSTLLKGPTGSGKKELVKELFKSTISLELLCLEAKALVFEEEDLKALPSFLEENKRIKYLLLFDFNENLLEKCGFLKKDSLVVPKYLENLYIFISSSEKNLKVLNFEEKLLSYLDFEEFLACSKQSEPSLLFKDFLAFGPMLKCDLNTFIRANFSELEQTVLKSLALEVGEVLSINKLYLNLKKKHKISKDKLYEILKKLEDNFVLSYVYHLQKPMVKRVFFTNFTLKATLCTQKNFSNLFLNVVFCELLKLGKEVKFDKEFDFLIENSAFIVAPFKDLGLMLLKARKLSLKLFNLKLENLYFISLNHEYELRLNDFKVKVVSFDKFALSL